MRWLVFLLAFLLFACGGEESSEPAEGSGSGSSTTEGGGGLKPLGDTPTGLPPRTPAENAPPPVDPLAAVLEKAESGLNSSDPDVQLEALDRVFSAKGDRARRARLIARALESEDDDVRLTAAELLGKMEESVVAANLESLLQREEDPTIRKTALVSLYQLKGKDAVTTLAKVVADQDEGGNTRAMAAQLLGKTGSELAIRPLMTALEEDFNAAVRREAVRALTSLKAKKASGLMIDALKDSDSLVRTEAAKGLGELKTKKAVGPLVEALDPEHEEDANVLEAVSKALGRIAGFDEEDMADYLYDPNKSEAELKEVVQNWQDWWEENKESYE